MEQRLVTDLGSRSATFKFSSLQTLAPVSSTGSLAPVSSTSSLAPASAASSLAPVSATSSLAPRLAPVFSPWTSVSVPSSSRTRSVSALSSSLTLVSPPSASSVFPVFSFSAQTPVSATLPAPVSPPAHSGGYEYKFLDDPVPERFLCNICTKVLKDARLTECCGQHYCDSCLATWLKQQKTCPHCRKENFQSIINKEKIREIKELRIRCTNREKGCDWVGEMGTLEDHLKSDKGCGYEIVKCSDRGKDNELCGMSLERRYLPNHKENKCKYRPYTCEYCGYKDTFEGIVIGYKKKEMTMLCLPFHEDTDSSSHYSTCDQYPLVCPNKCGETNIKRKDMKGHRDICPLEQLKCPFELCPLTPLRKYMENHKRMCEYRPYTCEYCGHCGTFRDIRLGVVLRLTTSHYYNCDQYPLKCPNDCGETNIKRRDMKGHRDICPLEPLDCPFKDAGCTDKTQRKDMEKHIESSTQHHLMMAFKSHQKMIEELSKANQELMKANQELKTRVEKLEKK